MTRRDLVRPRRALEPGGHRDQCFDGLREKTEQVRLEVLYDLDCELVLVMREVGA